MDSTLSMVSFFGKQTFSNFSVSKEQCAFDFSIVPGNMVPSHFHKEADEIFKIANGELTFKMQGKKIIAKAGDTITVPKGVAHEIANRSKITTNCRVTYLPCSDQDKFFKVWNFLIKKNVSKNGTMDMMAKGFYICRKLGNKDFSTPGNIALRIPTELFISVIMLVGNINGWNKHAEEYNKSDYNF